VSEDGLPVTFMQRFPKLLCENKSVILIVVNYEKASIYSEARANITSVLFEEIGSGVGAEKMKNYDF
jgi:hypothetical protein